MSTSSHILDEQTLLHIPLQGWHLIEANAGTGKTFTLANLYLRFLLQGRNPNEILVVTFTRAATAELKERLQARIQQALAALATLQPAAEEETDPSLRNLLLEALHQDQPDQVQLRLQLALNRMDEAQITTIHGFCHHVLRELSMESGHLPTETLEESNQSRAQAVTDWIRVHGMQQPLPEPALWAFVQQQQLTDPAQLEKTLTTLLQPAAATLVPAAPEDWKNLQQSLLQQLNTIAQQWHELCDDYKEALLSHKGISKDKRSGLHPQQLEKDWPAVESWWQQPSLPIPDTISRYCSQKELDQRHKPSEKNKGNMFQHPFAMQFDSLLVQARQLEHAYIQAIVQWVRKREDLLKQQQETLNQDDLLIRVDEALQQPTRGERLAGQLRARYPVAMIDEFQDTDAAQYRIFHKLYQPEHLQEKHCVFLIGDPKQSIYRFRGSDIHTYLRARHAIAHENRWQLDTNWRSTPEMISGINELFSRHDNAWMHEKLRYFPSQPPQQHKAKPLLLDGQPLPALHCLLNENPMKSEAAGQTLAQAVARQISHMLCLATTQRLVLGDRPLQAGDIAILVRSHAQAAQVRDALVALNIGCAVQEQESIWDSPEALDMQTLLLVMLQPEESSHLRQLLACGLMALGVDEQLQWQKDDHRWGQLLQTAQQAHQLAHARGFLSGWTYLFQALQPNLNLHRLPRPRRTLGNLLQLSELLQQEAHAGVGLSGLLQRLRQRRGARYQEAWEPRMEGEENLVQVLTIHKSKGLQFPVVFAPWLDFSKPKRSVAVQWNEQQQQCWALKKLATEKANTQAMEDLHAEDVRLAYVALTRAESCLWTAWGYTNKREIGSEILSWLLLGCKAYKPGKEQSLRQVLQQHWPDVTLHGVEERCAKILADPEPHDSALHFSQFTRSLKQQWRWHSFSSLTRNLAHATSLPKEEQEPLANLPLRFSFPAGPNPGNFLHALLEVLDYQQPLAPQLPQWLQRFGLRYGIANEQMPIKPLVQWLSEIIHTPFAEEAPALTEINPAERLHEMPFKLACQHIDINQLQQAGLLPEKAAKEQLAGLLTGVVDLVYHWQGRWWIADFKSNHLGNRKENYAPEQLHTAMQAHHYALQYHIYALALHRHLRQRLQDYDPEQHFGGVRYLFLRGMLGTEHPGSGIHTVNMHAEQLRWLDEEVFPWQAERVT